MLLVSIHKVYVHFCGKSPDYVEKQKHLGNRISVTVGQISYKLNSLSNRVKKT